MSVIGIIGAMDEEVARLKEQMQNVRITTKAMMDFYQGMLEGKQVVVVRSGIGKSNAAVCTQILVDDFQVSAVINTGIAGSCATGSISGISLYPQMPCITIWMQLNLAIRWDRCRVWMSFPLKPMRKWLNWQKKSVRKSTRRSMSTLAVLSAAISLSPTML